VVTNEKDIWFTKKKDADTLFAIVKEKERWKRGEWKDLVLRSVRATPETKVTVLGQNDLVLEYQPNVVPKTTWHQEADGLHIRAMHTQRLQDNSQWPNPVVLKLTNVKPALRPPVVLTSNAARNSSGAVVFEGNLKDLGDEKSLEVGFEYRSITGQDANERTSQWVTAGSIRRSETGDFSLLLKGLKPGEVYEYRAVAKHPLLTIYGAEKKLALP